MITRQTMIFHLGKAHVFRHMAQLAALLLFCCVPAWADIFEDAAGLGSGINLGNTLESPVEGEWGFLIEDQHFQLIRNAGFDSVRIPISWSTHTDEQANDHGTYAISQTFFNRVDTVLEQAKSHGLKVVLDVHHYRELNKEPTGSHKDRYLSIWKQIAKHYQNEPRTVFFELLNEPNDNDENQLGPQAWEPIMLEALSVVRKSNPDRPVIIGGAPWNGVESLQGLKLPADDRNLIGTFHYYKPMPFTHQGATWAADLPAEGSNNWLGTAEQRQAIEDDFQLARTWSAKNNRPVYLGEFGTYGGENKLNPLEDRARWTTFVRQQAEQSGFHWAYWEFGAGFGVYDRDAKQWNDSLLKSLLSP